MELPKRYGSWLTVNRTCNLRCKWCYADPTKFENGEVMTLDTVEDSIKLFKGLPLDRVILIGGEPTIHPDFFTIIEMVRDAGLKPALVTNGIKLKNKNFLQKILDAGMTSITISLKAPNYKLYKEFTGRYAFDDTIKAIQNVVDCGITHAVTVTVGESLYGEGLFDELLEAVKLSRTKWLSLEMEKPMIQSGVPLMPDTTKPRTLAKFLVEVQPKIEASGIKYTINIAYPFCLFPGDYISKLLKEDRITSGCHTFGGQGIIIDPKGKLLPCNHFCENPLGELGVDFSTGDEYIKFRHRADVKKFYEILSSYPDKRCQGCEYWSVCGAGCRVSWLTYDASDLMPMSESAMAM